MQADAGDGEVVILTTEPNSRVRSIHRRMPVILRADLLSGWLNPALPFLSLPQDFLTPWPSDDMDLQPPEPDRLAQQPELF
jgi:putative SOS response-associated peptidase YedK